MNISKSSLDAMIALKALIKKSGSQLDAAKALFISPTYLSDVLSGRRPISENIANRLGFTWKCIPMKEKK